MKDSKNNFAINKKEILENLQNYISLGYLLLLVLGIIKDGIFYGFLDLNILSYSNFLDVLISPLAYLTGNIIIPLSVVFITFLFIGVSKFATYFNKKYKDRPWYEKWFVEKKKDSETEGPASSFNLLSFVVVCTVCFYLGAGIGGGGKIANQMKNNELKTIDTITFLDNTSIETKIVGRNSEFIFYVKKGSKNVSVSPIKGTIKEIVDRDSSSEKDD